MVKNANGNIYPNKFNGYLKKGYRAIVWSFMKLLTPLKYSYFGLSLIFRGMNRIFWIRKTVNVIFWSSIFILSMRVRIRLQEL